MGNINTEVYWDNKFKRTKKFRYHPFENIINIIGESIKNPKEILDLGCALGDFQVLSKKHFNNSRIIGIDFSKEAIDRCKNNYPDMEWIKADLPDLSMFSNDSVDVVTIIETLEHINNPEDTVNEMHRILRKGGIGIISVPYGKTLDLREHVNCWLSEKSMGKFIEKTKFEKSYEFKKHGKILFFRLNILALLHKI
jgi:ubiquinone/menaquinone biosynthesis C-methylase UbiE